MHIQQAREVVLQFVQTRGEVEHLRTPEVLTAWLAERGLLEPGGSPATEADLRTAIRLRAALTSLFGAHNGGTTDARTAGLLANVTAAAPFEARLGADGALELAPRTSDVAGAFSTIVGAVYQLTLTGEIERYKACRSCNYPFFDVSKNRSRVWCDMAGCGSREKSQAYRERKAKLAAEQGH